MKPIPPYSAQHRGTLTFRDGATWDMTINGSSFVSEKDAQRLIDLHDRATRPTSGPPQA
ncbi:hypothetical protein [Brachybacterium epidermidis]|uniref:hypothetical protein n=1 Tax=Brachybacterium epidermidis TaxID=2781983 RepID=UPI00398F6974